MAYDIPVMKKQILAQLKRGDMSVQQLSGAMHASRPTLRRWLAQMAEVHQVFHYTQPDNAAVRIYTLDRTKHKEDAYSRVKRKAGRQLPQGIIPGARVFLFDDPAREEINRAIMLSQRTRTKVTAHPGTSWGDVALRMPFA
jgi:DeoR/GlpR family transcriptional regulator of sugar metabolism